LRNEVREREQASETRRCFDLFVRSSRGFCEEEGRNERVHQPASPKELVGEERKGKRYELFKHHHHQPPLLLVLLLHQQQQSSTPASPASLGSLSGSEP